MKLPAELKDAIRDYRQATPWYAQWPLIIAAIPLFIIMLAIALGITIGEAIAILCTSGDMPTYLRWLCF